MRTATDRAWVWRLHLDGTAYVVTNHTGVCYRRGVTTSLTQIYDMPAELLAELNRRSTDMIASFPAELVRTQLEQSDPQRWVTLRDVLPPDIAPRPELVDAHVSVSPSA